MKHIENLFMSLMFEGFTYQDVRMGQEINTLYVFPVADTRFIEKEKTYIFERKGYSIFMPILKENVLDIIVKNNNHLVLCKGKHIVPEEMEDLSQLDGDRNWDHVDELDKWE